MKNFTAYFIVAAAFCSCTEHYFSEQVDVIQLGAKEKVITLSDEKQGEGSFDIYANCDWDYLQISGGEWLFVDNVKAVEGEQNRYTLHFSHYANNGYPRSSKLVVYKDNRFDTLQVRQKGLITHSISICTFTEGVIPAKGGSYSVVVETTVPERDLKVSASVPSQFSELYYSGHRLYFTVNPAVERDKKPYVLKVYTVDGWGETLEGSITIYQAAREE